MDNFKHKKAVEQCCLHNLAKNYIYIVSLGPLLPEAHCKNIFVPIALKMPNITHTKISTVDERSESHVL